MHENYFTTKKQQRNFLTVIQFWHVWCANSEWVAMALLRYFKQRDGLSDTKELLSLANPSPAISMENCSDGSYNLWQEAWAVQELQPGGAVLANVLVNVITPNAASLLVSLHFFCHTELVPCKKILLMIRTTKLQWHKKFYTQNILTLKFPDLQYDSEVLIHCQGNTFHDEC